jgi:hypothetical protein
MLLAVGGSGISETVISFKIMKRIILLNQIIDERLIHQVCLASVKERDIG